jgi:F0F1-type ATP synthase delta subunit
MTAPSAFISKIISWFRKEVNPQILLQVGVQPNITAGCVLRTPNKYFDLSLKQRMLQNKDSLAQKLNEALK